VPKVLLHNIQHSTNRARGIRSEISRLLLEVTTSVDDWRQFTAQLVLLWKQRKLL